MICTARLRNDNAIDLWIPAFAGMTSNYQQRVFYDYLMKFNKKINTLIEKILEKETRSYFYMSEELRKLSHLVIFTHARIENLLEIFILADLSNTNGHKYDVLTAARHYLKMKPVFDKMTFMNKYEICKKKNLLSKKLKRQCSIVNEHRIKFSHLSSYSNDLKEYDNEDQYIKTLQDLMNCFDEIENNIQIEMSISKSK